VQVCGGGLILPVLKQYEVSVVPKTVQKYVLHSMQVCYLKVEAQPVS